MGEESSFLLVDLKEDKAKKLAQVISNDSCRKILDYLTHKDKATETEISKDLKLALSTVHYNLKHLNKSGLVIVEEFHYSQKGKEVNHYKLANKFIIIATSNNPSLFPIAPVNDPLTCPNSSLCRSVSGIAPQFTLTKGPVLRREE